MNSTSNPSEVRVRFAPSPTGFLHVGGARTALFNWLFAKANGGKFLLRIEDTDRERSQPQFTQDILKSLEWLGLNWDEEPVYQSARFDRYRSAAEQLIRDGLAYPCDCTAEMLDRVRAQCEKEKRSFRYPGTCRDKKTAGPNHVIRAKLPRQGETKFTDLIRGDISFQNKDLDDWVMLRADGSPTYNFCVVVDDHDQGMTHILRGDDHINNTPKQILLYQALKFPVPHFAHLPMILGPDRSKLSKRHGAASTLEYRGMGYLPDALINFLVRLGWSYGDQEIFSIEELKKVFSLKNIGKANAIFSTEKLDWVSGHFMKETPAGELAAYVKLYFAEKLPYIARVSDESFARGVSIIQGKVKTILELIEQLDCLFGEDPAYDVSGIKAEDRAKMVDLLKPALVVMGASNFEKADVEQKVKAEIGRLAVKPGPMFQAVRWAVTGGKVSPGLFEMLEVQGKDRVLGRIEKAIASLG